MSKVLMLNGYIAGVALSGGKNTSGFVVPDSEKAYKKLKVVNSNEDLVPEGSVITVPIHCGTEVEVDGQKRVVVNVREVILIEE